MLREDEAIIGTRIRWLDDIHTDNEKVGKLIAVRVKFAKTPELRQVVAQIEFNKMLWDPPMVGGTKCLWTPLSKLALE